MRRVLIHGGTVVTADTTEPADVLVEDERIVEVAPALDPPDVDERIDATGLLVLPGGVDPHTHLDWPFGELMTSDGYDTGTLAAAHGGTTSVVNFCFQPGGVAPTAAVERSIERIGSGGASIDVGLHLAVTDLPDASAVEDLAQLPDLGVTSFKVFLAYPGVLMVDDATLFQVLRTGREAGCMTLVHAENGPVIELLVQEALAAGNVSPIWHARTRPPLTESEATGRAIDLAALAGDAPLYVVHVSCREAAAEVARARAAGQRVWGETCPQYLVLDESVLEAPGWEGAKFVFTPPPRAAEHQEAVWDALAEGTLSVVATDHCPFSFAEVKTAGVSSFADIPNGLPGIEHRLSVMHHDGVVGGRLSLQDLVRLTSEAPARIFGLWGRKGTIAPGFDADLVLFDPEERRVVRAAEGHSAVDYSPYEGRELTGWARTVLVRGTVVVRDGETATTGGGRFLSRDRVEMV